jgi:hypothetical protein
MLCHAEDVHSKSYKGEGMLNQFAQHIVHHLICLAYSFPCSILQLKVKRCKLCKHHGLFLVRCHIDILQASLPILYERPMIKTKPSNKPTCGPYYLNWIWFPAWSDLMNFEARPVFWLLSPCTPRGLLFWNLQDFASHSQPWYLAQPLYCPVSLENLIRMERLPFCPSRR